MRLRNNATITVVFVLSFFGAAYSKANTSFITVTGPGLPQPLHVSDDEVLSANVWGGNFVNWEKGAVPGLPSKERQYRLHFWVRIGSDDVRLVYAVQYHRSATSGLGVVCFPGANDPWYRLNVRTIYRGEFDGNCFEADADWQDALNSVLEDHT